MEFTENNISDFRIEILVGAEVYITVEAPGYEDWERVVEASAAVYEEVVLYDREATELSPPDHCWVCEE